MPHTHLRILEIVRDQDPSDPRAERIRAVCEEMQPRKFNLNLSKQNADVIQKFAEHIGGIAMVPTRSGTLSDGTPFISYDKDAEFISIQKGNKPFAVTDKPKAA